MHRFEVLSLLNKYTASLYALIFIFSFFSFSKIIKLSIKLSQINLFLLALIIFSTINGIINNSLINVFSDFVIILLQIFSFNIAIKFLYSEDNLFFFTKLNILISIFIGFVVYLLGVDFDLVSPAYGFFIISILFFIVSKYRNLIYYWASFISFNLFWSFGKINLLVSIFFMYFSMYKKSRNNNRYAFSFSKALFFYLIILFITLYMYFYHDFVRDIDLGFIKKLFLFVDNLNISYGFDVVLSDPSILYKVFDLSTAGRLYEIFLFIKIGLLDYFTLIFGGGLGESLDLSEKNDLTNLSYSFKETASMQTGIAFLLTRFGFFGLIFFFIYIFIFYKKKSI